MTHSFYYTTTPLHHYTTAPLHDCATTQLHDYTTTRLHDYTTTRLHDYPIALALYYSTTIGPAGQEARARARDARRLLRPAPPGLLRLLLVGRRDAGSDSLHYYSTLLLYYSTTLLLYYSNPNPDPNPQHNSYMTQVILANLTLDITLTLNI